MIVAYVKMHQIKSTLSKAIAYISRGEATDDGLWVSTNAAVIDPSDSAAVARQFASTTERVGVTKPREGSVHAHHVIQSFDPSEHVDAEVAHRLGVQLAEQFTGGSHEYVVATHRDKEHIHNHIIINATNLETGRKLRVGKSTLGSIRAMSDVLCKEAGLSVLPTPERATGRTMADTYRVLKGQSAKEYVRTEIDKAALVSRTWVEFEAALNHAGVETTTRPGRNASVSFRFGSEMRPVRDFRLGEAYTQEAIMARLSRSAVNRITFDQSMIVKETKDAMTVVVPGSGRRLHLTVAKSQIVRHGRTVRAFIPAVQAHMLSDRAGKLSKSVPTGGLYRWFSEPDVAGIARQTRQGSAWAESLAGLRELQDQINAKARWVGASGRTPDEALSEAKRKLSDTRMTFQTRLVAVAELITAPERGDDLRVLQAEVRITEREIETLKRDVGALTTLTLEEMKMAVSDRITSGVEDRRRDHQAQRLRLEDQANDRETPAEQMERDDENTEQVVEHNDAEEVQRSEDQQADTARPLTLAERIEAEAERRGRDDDDRASRTQRPTR